MQVRESKRAPRFAGLFFVNLVAHRDVGSLGTLGALFNIELDLLAFGQVTESIALNGGEMDENVLSTFAFDKTETLVTIEPLDGTTYSFRHCICLLWQFKKFFRHPVCSIGGQNKNSPRIETVSCGCSSNQRNLPLSYKKNNNRLTGMSQPIFVNNIYELKCRKG